MTALSLRRTCRGLAAGHVAGFCLSTAQAGEELAAKQVTTRAGMALKPVEDLKKLHSAMDRDMEVVVYCQSGVRSRLTATQRAANENQRAAPARFIGDAV